MKKLYRKRHIKTEVDKLKFNRKQARDKMKTSFTIQRRTAWHSS